MRGVVALVLIGCAHPAVRTPEHDLDRDDAPGAVAAGATARALDLLAAPSVVATASSPVRAEPTASAARIGIIGRDAHAKAIDARPASEGCDRRWIAIAPRGWVCEANLAASTDPPTAATPVPLDDATAPELGAYGGVRDTAGSTTAATTPRRHRHPADGGMIVHETGVVEVRGLRFVVASDGSLFDPRSVGALTPSSFHGTPVDGALHVGWTRRGADVRATPAGRIASTLTAHAQVAIAESRAGSSGSRTASGSPAPICASRRSRPRPRAPAITTAGSTSTSASSGCWSRTRAFARSTRRSCPRGDPTTPRRWPTRA